MKTKLSTGAWIAGWSLPSFLLIGMIFLHPSWRVIFFVLIPASAVYLFIISRLYLRWFKKMFAGKKP